MSARRWSLVAAGLWVLTCPARGADWPQWRGPRRDGVSAETGLLKTWPKEGPPLLWTFDNAGVGYSGPAVVGGRLYLIGGRSGDEHVIALDLPPSPGGTVREVWSARVGPIYGFKGNQWARGPRATPAVAGGLVYALGGQGELVCVEAAKGRERWRVNLRIDLGGEVNPDGAPPPLGWGYTSSPLVDGDRVVCVPGGSRGTLAALDRQTGKVIWRSTGLTDLATYASPIVADVDGVRQYIQPTHRGVAGVAADDGRLLWHYEKPVELAITTPLFQGRYVFVTAYYNGCHLIELTAAKAGFNARRVYATRAMTNQHGGVVLVGKHLYGYAEGKGWVCQDFRTGKIAWSNRNGLGRGSLVYADGCLYCFGEDDGELALVEATPAGWKARGRLALPRPSARRLAKGKVWTHPVVADGRLYLRDQELLFCFDVRDHSARPGGPRPDRTD